MVHDLRVTFWKLFKLAPETVDKTFIDTTKHCHYSLHVAKKSTPELSPLYQNLKIMHLDAKLKTNFYGLGSLSLVASTKM